MGLAGGGALTTDLTPVAVNMEITIQSHNPDSLLLARGRHDRLLAHRTAGSKQERRIGANQEPGHLVYHLV